MEQMLTMLYAEKKRIELSLQEMADATLDAQLHQVNSDIERLEMYHGRPTMETFSELIFTDDIRLRINQMLAKRS